MYFDRHLWQLTRGLRGRIALAILIGLAAAAFGIARFTLLGTMLARVFTGSGFGPVALAAAGVAAAVVLRGVLDHWRTIIAHRTSAQVQTELRRRLYDKIAELGPAWFAGERTGGVMLSVVDGVEQLQTFFGQYVPQVYLAATTMKVLATSVMTRGITDCGVAVGAASALALGVYRVSHGETTIQALLIVLMAGTEVYRPLRDLRAVLHQGL